ncbi:MAG: hypothetical protein LUI14_14470 [Lachnospiraceae bacterium]|nr:hypothetical protein [Lachnospiraceae bacterium]
MELNEIKVEGTVEEVRAILDAVNELMPYVDDALKKGKVHRALTMLNGIGLTYTRYETAVFEKEKAADSISWLKNRVEIAKMDVLKDEE